VDRKTENTIRKVALWIVNDPQFSQYLPALSLIHQFAERQYCRPPDSGVRTKFPAFLILSERSLPLVSDYP
jgi:hypothetical protein